MDSQAAPPGAPARRPGVTWVPLRRATCSRAVCRARARALAGGARGTASRPQSSRADRVRASDRRVGSGVVQACGCWRTAPGRRGRGAAASRRRWGCACEDGAVRAARSRCRAAGASKAGASAADPSASRSVANATTVSSARSSTVRNLGPAVGAEAGEERLSGANGGRLGIGAERVGWGNMCSRRLGRGSDGRGPGASGLAAREHRRASSTSGSSARRRARAPARRRPRR
jgi:hypothetical protein